MHLSFLLHNAYSLGGTIRSTFNLAGELARRHDVEIVSVFRHHDEPTLPAPRGVRLRHLVDLRKDSPGYDGEDPEHRRPAKVFPRGDGRHSQYSRLTDARIGAHLAQTGADVVIGTRPGLNVHIARGARPGVVRVGQEHLTLTGHSYRLRSEIAHSYPLLDAVTTVTRADAEAYRALNLPGVRVDAVPNSVPAPRLAPASGDSRLVVAAGRLTPVKRYDLLVRAFAQVVAVRPDWRLRIHGSGDAFGNERESLRNLIDDLGLYNHVFLMGLSGDLDSEWVKGSLAAVTSSHESFGMTIVEAMRCGLPVVSTDCPQGPREIIHDTVDGRLVETGSADAVAAGLLELIQDDALRHRMARAALENSRRFDPAAIAGQHEALFADLHARGGGSRSAGPLRQTVHRARTTALDGAYALRHKAASALRKGQTA
ncbi:glycosyltransferase family 4 protein [Streptomyces sp. NPDC048111]|uniref:glycosyltransferase family 4 protein n=1 Tax=Streptomyces sp. NPDC048111 TaxID=3365500 RepID=UPI00371185DA